MNERLSDPAEGVLGRFISRDPIGFAGGLNLYSYPTNPVNSVDPTGLDQGLDGAWNNYGKVKPPTPKYTQQQYMETLNATMRFLQQWNQNRHGSQPQDLCLITPHATSIDTLTRNLQTAFDLKNVVAGETTRMKIFNNLGFGATMQTTGLGGVRDREIYVNRFFLDEMIASGAGPAEIGAGLLHESGHLDQGCSRYVPGAAERETSKIYDGDQNLTLRDTLQSYYESLNSTQQRAFFPHGYPFAR